MRRDGISCARIIDLVLENLSCGSEPGCSCGIAVSHTCVAPNGHALSVAQVFRSRVLECKSKLSKIENACDDVKLSGRLKKVLKTILRVGNQLNDGEKHSGGVL
jgi:hypothetical protein